MRRGNAHIHAGSCSWPRCSQARISKFAPPVRLIQSCCGWDKFSCPSLSLSHHLSLCMYNIALSFFLIFSLCVTIMLFVSTNDQWICLLSIYFYILESSQHVEFAKQSNCSPSCDAKPKTQEWDDEMGVQKLIGRMRNESRAVCIVRYRITPEAGKVDRDVPSLVE